jgi:hypothetical protein
VAWWTRGRIAAAALAAIVIGFAAFVYRFNSLSGSLGGFDNDHFAHLLRVDMLLSGFQPLRDFADAELRGAWPALSYAVPAWAQQVGGRSLLPEAYLTAGALAAAHAAVFLLALDLSKRWWVASAAAAAAIASAPKLYNYPKVLAVVGGAATVRLLAASPSIASLACAALVTAAATLFRHDYGVYVVAGVVTALLAGGERLLTSARYVAVYAMLTALALLPSALWIWRYEGIASYVTHALETTRIEMLRTELRMEMLELTQPVSERLLAATYYAFWAVSLLAAFGIVMFSRRQGGLRKDRRAVICGLLAIAVLVNIFFLRANLSQRFGDAIAPTLLIAAWLIGEGGPGRSARHRAVAVAVAVLLVFILLAAWRFGDGATKLRVGGMTESWAVATQRFDTVHRDLSGLPPVTWGAEEAEGTLAAARYLAVCTAPEDHVLVAAYAPEVPVFARRRFAAGQPTVSLGMYTSEDDQRKALARLARQSVPIILADARDFDTGFVSDYPLLATHIAAAYTRAGTIEVDREPRFLVFASTTRAARRDDVQPGLPCFR